MLNYGTTRFQPHLMNYVLAETWESFTLSAVNIIRDIFAKDNLPPLIPPNTIINKQAYVSSIQTSSKGINQIVEEIPAPINLIKTRNKKPMVIILEKGITQKPTRYILLQTTAYNTVQKKTVLHLQDTKREFTMIIKKRKAKLANEGTTTRRNPDLTPGIYLTAVKVAQYIQVDENRREKEYVKR